MTDQAPSRPAPVDLAHHSHLTGVFAPQREEVDVADLPVRGEIPADLRGSYLRNGPNPRFDPIGSFVYPLDGDGMVHRIEIADGRVGYTNRFVRTPMVLAEEAAGHAIWSGLTDGYTPPASEVGDALANTFRELPDINIVRHSGRLMAMAESDQPYLMNPKDLATLSKTDCGGAMRVGSTAHPKADPGTGELVLFNYSLEAPYLTWSVIAADGTVTRPPTPVTGLDESVMIHDMALTSRYLVLFVCPLLFDLAAAFSGGSLLSWRPADGTRIALIPRDGGPLRWLTTDPFWVWHFANAFDRADGSVVVDYVEWTYPGGFATEPTPPSSALTRAIIHPDGQLSRNTISDKAIDMEFPRVDDRLLTLDHKRVASVASAPGDTGSRESLWFHDLAAGTETHWSPGVAIGEPVFIPGESGDYWAAIGTDPAELRSYFYLLAAEEPEAGPIATVDLPIRVPAGLHGAWLPDLEQQT